VPEVERKRRVRALVGLDAELGAAVRQSFVGEIRPVLWESRDPIPRAGTVHVTDPRQPVASLEEEGRDVWSGLTDNYLRVMTAAPAKVDLHNRLTPLRLIRVEGDVLWGEISTP